MDAYTGSAARDTLGDYKPDRSAPNHASRLAPLVRPSDPLLAPAHQTLAVSSTLLQRHIVESFAEQLRQHMPDATADTVRQNYLRAYNSPTVEALISQLRTHRPQHNSDVVRRAYALAYIAHDGQHRESGDPYIDHPVAVASMLLELLLDEASIAAALLHDVVEDTDVNLELLRQEFSDEIAYLVDGVTKLSGLDIEVKSKEEIQASSYRKMIVATAEDPRVVVIKLADRLHNMRTLNATSPEKQRRVARETLEIYAPLAHRLGIWRIKSELEDLAFKALSPDHYREISQQLTLRRDAREKIVQRVISKIKQLLAEQNISADVQGRPKHIYSIWRKMSSKGVALDQIYDQLAVRVIIRQNNVPADTNEKEANSELIGLCYRVLGIVHNLWPPIRAEFDDYIAVPKESSYQSLHTTVITPGSTPCEIQIRTERMHDVAEHGIAAHWRYKEGFGNASDQDFENKLKWLRELIAWRTELTDDREFVESLKPEFADHVYVFTPRGKIIDLPEGSTPIDFAYRIHSEIGNHCVGAKVNGRIVPLDHLLRNGEIVDVMTSKKSAGPSRDWLNFVKTPSGRNHIRRHFRRMQREDNIAAGRTMLEKEMKRLGVTLAFEQIADIAGARNVEELFAYIGSGEFTARSVAQKVLASQTNIQEIVKPTQIAAPPRSRTSSVQVRGGDSLLSRVAKCCSPIEGEPIVGFVTRGRGITVHRADCPTILNERDRDRLIDVSWGGHNPEGYSVPLRIESWDRVGLWRDLSALIGNAGINIEKLEQVQTRRAGRTVLEVVVTIQSINQLADILDNLNRIPDVIDARRESQSLAAAPMGD